MGYPESKILYKEYHEPFFWYSSISNSDQNKKNLNFDFILRPHIDSKNWFICIEIQIFCPKIHRDYHKTFYHITDSNVPIKEPLNSNEDFLDTIINIVHEDIQSLQDEIIDLDIIWGGCTIGFGSDDLKKQCIDKLSIYH